METVKLPTALRNRKQKADEEIKKIDGVIGEKSVQFGHQAPPVETPQPVQKAVEHPTPIKGGIDLNGSSDAEQKYKSLQGKYNAEVPRLNAEAKEARLTAEELRQQLEDQKAEIERLKKSTPQGIQSWANPEDIENYGEDYLKVAEKASRGSVESMVTPEMEALKAEISDLKRHQESQAETAYEERKRMMFQELKSILPNWESLNEDAGWKQWLGEIDYTGRPRQEALEDNISNLRADLVAQMFNSYFSNKPKDNEGLESFAQPELKRGNPVSGEKPTYTRAQVESWLAQIRSRKVKGDDATKLLKKITVAQEEGRIT